MSRYRKVDPRIWNDTKFRTLSNRGKLVFFMLLTHPHMTALGAMRATPGGLAEELGWPQEAFREAFGEVIAKGMARHDVQACLVALPNFVKYNLPESPNVIKAWNGALDLLPECELKDEVVSLAGRVVSGMTEAFAKAFREAFAKGMPNPEPKPEPKQKKTPPPPAGEPGRFSDFWEAWPKHERKVAREQCAAKWKAKGCDAIADQVLAALAAAKTSAKWEEDGGKYVPAPLVWLNQARWEAPTEADVQAENWTDSRRGIEDKGEQLGIGRWDQDAFEHGRGDAWPAYRAKVFRAAGVDLVAAA